MERILMIETSVDEKLLEEYKVILSEKGFKVAIQLGFVSQIK
jgi:manganese transport protein